MWHLPSDLFFLQLAQMKNVGIKHGIMNSNFHTVDGVVTDKLTLRQTCTDWHISENANISTISMDDAEDSPTMTVKEHDK